MAEFGHLLFYNSEWGLHPFQNRLSYLSDITRALECDHFPNRRRPLLFRDSISLIALGAVLLGMDPYSNKAADTNPDRLNCSDGHANQINIEKVGEYNYEYLIVPSQKTCLVVLYTNLCGCTF